MKTNPNDSINVEEVIDRWMAPFSPGSALCPVKVKRGGLTKREYFAALMLQSLNSVDQQSSSRAMAKFAVEQADSLIEELNKTDETSTNN